MKKNVVKIIKPEKSVRELELEFELTVANEIIKKQKSDLEYIETTLQATQIMHSVLKWEVEGLKYCIDRMTK